jgi:hypothetical protein
VEFIANLDWSKFNLRKLLLVLTGISFTGFTYLLVEISNLSPVTIGMSLLLSPFIGVILGMILFGIFNLLLGIAFLIHLFVPLFKRIILWFFK